MPAKQIYLLSIIIIGIIALSIYSTYALFTFESETSEIVSIHTPKSLQISENIDEYKQLELMPNSITTTDIDIYNTYDYDTCYSIWYKIIGTDIDKSKIQIFEKSTDALTSSGILKNKENIRITIAIINDNDKPVKINLGTTGSKKTSDNCSLNLATDKLVINTAYDKIEMLTNKIIENKDKTTEEPSHYLTYKDETDVITYKSTDKIYVSAKFNYRDELFTLEDPLELTSQELLDKFNSPYPMGDNNPNVTDNDIYFCKKDTKCNILYKITELKKEEPTNDTEQPIYHITKYDKLIGYSEGNNGLRKINDTDYVYYGDNPNNFIYYNCKNNDDVKTCELWRIIGVFYNQETHKYQTKIIRHNSIGTYQFNSSSIEKDLTWEKTTLHKYLNDEYKFLNNYDMYLDNHKQNTESLSSLDTEIKKTTKTIDSKINILSLSDYLSTSICKKNKVNEYTEDCLINNWLNNPEINNEWTLTIKEPIIPPKKEPDEKDDNNDLVTESPKDVPINNINYAYTIGNRITEYDVSSLQDVRPVVYLKSRMLFLGGDGTLEKPYIIK